MYVNAPFSRRIINGGLQLDRFKVAIRQRKRKLMLTMPKEADKDKADNDNDYSPSNRGMQKRRRLE